MTLSNSFVDNLIEDIISASDLGGGNITVSEVRDFIPAFLNIMAKDEYVTTILENLVDPNIDVADGEELEAEDYAESELLGADITETKRNKLIRLLGSLFKKIVQVLSIVKSLDSRNREEKHFSWQSYVRNRELKQEGQQYDLVIQPDKYGLKLTVCKIGKIEEKLLEINLTNAEIRLLRESHKNILEEIYVPKEIVPGKNVPKGNDIITINSPTYEQREVTNSFIKQAMQNVTISHVDSVTRSHSNNIMQQKQGGNLWTDWKEIGRQQDGNTVTISLQSQYHSHGVHKSVPSLPSFS